MNDRLEREPFYRFHPVSRAWYHVMKPAEGLLVIIFVHLLYMGLDVFKKKNSPVI